MSNPILVIGSVLLDIVGTYNNSERELINKIGKLNFSIGGVAYNMASNLSAKGRPTSILTCLKTDSISSKVIEEELRESNIKEYIYRTEIIDETGYVAHFCDKELKTGITSSEIEEIDLKQIRNISKAISNSSFVILDTNLSTDQICHISSICREKNKCVFVNVVSDAKFKRIYKKEFPCKFEAICIREEEIESQKIKMEEVVKSKQNIIDFCSDLNSKTVFINNELKGYFILSDTGEYEFNPVKYTMTDIKNTLGANDALFSAVCASAFDKEAITGNEVKMKIKEWVTSVLKTDKSNLKSSNMRKARKLDMYKIIASILFLLLAIIATIIGSFNPENLNLLLFGGVIFSIALFGGASGALTREMIAKLKNENKRNLPVGNTIALGMIAGTLASLIGILPGIASGGGIKELSKQDLLPLMIFIVSITTGIALELFFDNLSKKNANEIIDF